MVRVAVDIGGTFTDAVLIDDNGTTRTAKALTTPSRLHEGVLAAIDRLGVDWRRLDSITNGTTAGLNAFLERRGAEVALVTTRGFRDVYELGRANRPDMYNVRYRPPTPLIPRRSIFEVDERMAPDGSVVRPVPGTSVRELALRLAGDFRAVAICLLHSYANPTHEQEIADVIRSIDPTISIVCSSDIAPEWREYERTSTTAIAAYVAPIVEGYLSEIEQRTEERGMRGAFRVMQSNGGVMSAASARRKPIQTLFSGPVGGTMACLSLSADLAEEISADRLICVDMGGTSFDMSLVVDGRADVELESELQRHPVLAPSVAIHTIGAGGGSVGHLAGGGLRVGPRSAGASPGPACYGAGGTEPTITDANLFLGRLPSTTRLAGGMTIDRAAAEGALLSVAERVGLDVGELASGMIAVADSTMANAIREITVMRGIDPRDFVLVAFGGAGPLHAVSLAEELDLGAVVVPVNPGVLSAYGMLSTDTRHDAVQSFYVRVSDLTEEALEAALAELEERARLMVKEDGFDDQAISLEPSADLRYSGQEYTVTLPLDTTRGLASLIAQVSDQFAEAHEVRYGHSNPGEAVEFVNLRMAAFGAMTKPRPAPLPTGAMPKFVDQERTMFTNGWRDTPVYHRSTLPPGGELAGPSIVLEDACTTLIPPGWSATVSRHGHLLITRRDQI